MFCPIICGWEAEIPYVVLVVVVVVFVVVGGRNLVSIKVGFEKSAFVSSIPIIVLFSIGVTTGCAYVLVSVAPNVVFP